jgi:O-antigen/teichoic acid export membrane protein
MNWKNLATSLGLQYIGRVIGLGVSLFSVAFLSRFLGVNTFGDYTAAVAIASLVVTFSDFGFFWSTVQSFLHNDGKLDAIKDILGIRTIVTFSLIIVSVILVTFGNFSVPVKEAFLILSIFIFSTSINNILIAIYQAEYKMLWPSIIDVLSRVVNLTLILIGVHYHLSLQWFIIAVSCAALVSLVANWIGLSRNNTHVWPRILGVSWGKYYHSVVLVGLMALFSTLFYRTDIIILTWMKSSQDVGIYGMAQKITDLVTMMQGLFMASLFPLLVSRHKENRELFNHEMSRAIIISAVIGLPIGIFGYFLTHDIVSIVGGQQFLTESTVTIANHAFGTPQVLMIMFAFATLYYLSTPFTMGTLASGKVEQLIKVNILATIVNIGLNIWFIPHYSYVTTATTTFLTEIVVLVFNGIYFCKLHAFRPPYAAFFRVIIATLPGFAFLLITPHLSFPVRLIALGLIYATSIWLIVPDVRDAVKAITKKSGVPLENEESAITESML